MQNSPDNTNIKKTSGTPNLYFDTRDNVFFERDPVQLFRIRINKLRLTPPEVFQMAYGVDSSKIADALSSIKESVVIGPLKKESPQNLIQIT
ncbi:hypothetical protein [Cytobacillus firmus]|uniref:hypothetical protein n=1 Tax=Cytobacillus firmus TaxID=1399 RepID=UPI0021611A6C|nr:hypothetical protein [Cytobacillus firmus]MCS0670290.1 hypothetical protein [Cytobacillus firmus]